MLKPIIGALEMDACVVVNLFQLPDEPTSSGSASPISPLLAQNVQSRACR
jgi:hypothetical protein